MDKIHPALSGTTSFGKLKDEGSNSLLNKLKFGSRFSGKFSIRPVNKNKRGENDRTYCCFHRHVHARRSNLPVGVTAKCAYVLDSNPYMFIVVLTTVISLFASNFTTAFLDKDFDIVTIVVLSVCFIFFFIDLFAQIFTFPAGVWKTLYFWFDVFGTLSLITELPWLIGLLGLDFSSLTLAKTSRLLRMNTKLIKCMRLFKLFRITKLMKFVGTQENTETVKDVMIASYGDVKIRVARNPSALGARTAGIVTNRCIIMLMIVTFAFPFMDASKDESGTKVIETLKLLECVNPPADVVPLFDVFRESQPNLIYLNLKGNILLQENTEQTNELRESEMINLSTSTGSLATINIKENLKNQYILDMALVLLLMCVLVYISQSIAADSKRLVTAPLEKMTQMVTKLTHTLMILGGDRQMKEKLVKTKFLTSVIEEQMQAIWDSAAQNKELSKSEIAVRRKESKFAKELVAYKRGSLSESRAMDKYETLFREYTDFDLSQFLDCPFGSEYFRQYCLGNFISENYMFVNDSIRFGSEFCNRFDFLTETYITEGSPGEINISASLRARLLALQEPSEINPFALQDACSEIFRLLEVQSLDPFKNSTYFKEYINRLVELTDKEEQARLEGLKQQRCSVWLRTVEEKMPKEIRKSPISNFNKKISTKRSRARSLGVKKSGEQLACPKYLGVLQT